MDPVRRSFVEDSVGTVNNSGNCSIAGGSQKQHPRMEQRLHAWRGVHQQEGDSMRFGRLMLLAGLVALPQVSLHAQTQTNSTAEASLGLVARAQKAHIGDAGLTEGSTIYSGDYVSTEDGGLL